MATGRFSALGVQRSRVWRERGLARTCMRSPCRPNRLRISTAPFPVLPNQCGSRASNSAASPRQDQVVVGQDQAQAPGQHIQPLIALMDSDVGFVLLGRDDHLPCLVPRYVRIRARWVPDGAGWVPGARASGAPQVPPRCGPPLGSGTSAATCPHHAVSRGGRERGACPRAWPAPWRPGWRGPPRSGRRRVAVAAASRRPKGSARRSTAPRCAR
jgi:hypothetical protein